MVDQLLTRTDVATPALSRPRRFRLINLPVWAWLTLIVLLPNLLLIGTSFLRIRNGFMTFEPSLANYQRLWDSAGFWALLFRTLKFSLLGSGIAALIAYPMAYFVGRGVRRNKALLVTLVLVPLWISLLMRVFAWRLILGQSGLLNSFLVSSGVLDKPSEAFLYTSASVVLVFTYIAIPYIFISTLNAFEKLPQSLLEASEDSGASGLRTFLHVVWPLTRRSLAIGVSLAFLITVGDFVTPAMIGGVDGTTIGVMISSQFGMANNWPYGAAVAIVLMLCCGAIVGIVMALCPARGVLLGDEGQRPAARDTPGARTLRLAGSLGVTLTVLFLYAPILLMAAFSFNASSMQSFPMAGFSLRWYEELAGNQGLLVAAQRSLLVAFMVVTFSTIVGTSFALILHYGKIAGARFCEFTIGLPIATPGVVLGIVMVLGTEWLKIPSGVIRTTVGQSSFVLPVVMMLVLSRLRRLDPSLLEASLDLGADKIRSFVFVLFPLIRGAVVGGALLGLTLSADDVMVTLFLAGPQQTLPIWVFNQMRFGFTPTVNAVFALLAVACLAIVIVATRIGAKARGATA
ncbi:ABC transporter permease subunit [Hansschlegelia plantiphila]|uniref:ABC transporter permease n=1 Tax=Hansschlegelia plantiphila TaxID=374655 RepID=A0A9W6MVZ4_9HYPH|nr:ABC transporter permease subunit [Hansschlegelia plantiphila]GLK68307.1 ABC transporter permease [Hansschlegelia plantiphila]